MPQLHVYIGQQGRFQNTEQVPLAQWWGDQPIHAAAAGQDHP